MGFVIIELLSLIVYVSLETAQLDPGERAAVLGKWSIPQGWCFFSLSFVLLLCVYFLISRMKKKRDQITSSQTDQEIYNKEIHTLMAILCIFSSTYMARGSWALFSAYFNKSKFVQTLIPLFIGLICDFAPVMVLLVFHFKNFGKKIEVPE